MNSSAYLGRLTVSLALLCLACKDDVTSPPVPHALQIVDGDQQNERPGVPLPHALRVRVVDSSDEPVPGTTVQWGVTIGSATLNPAQAVTNSDGIAETRVVLESISEVFVSAAVPGLLPVVFALRGIDPCEFFSWPSMTVGTWVTGTLQSFDCEDFGGHFNDSYPFYAEGQAIVLEMQSTTFDPLLKFYSSEPWHLLAWDTVNTTRHVRRKVILPPGQYALIASSVDSRATGTYTARVTFTPESQESCEFVMIMAGAVTTQNLSSTDCAGASDRFEDRFWLVLMEGETVTLTLSSRHFTPYLRLLHNGEVVAEVDGTVTGPATLTFTSDELTAYDVHASSTEPQQPGEYTLFISRGAPASPRVTRPGQFRGLGGIGAGIGVGTRGLESRPSGSPR